jgi:ribonuclease J
MIKDKKKEEKLEIIPLGGLGEVGRNMTLFQYKGKILVLDMGLGFPGEDMPGVDCTIPDVSYLKGKERNILGSIITHGHYDHIGAIPYILPKIGPVPIYTSPLTKGMILRRELDFPSQPHLNIKTINDGSKIKLGDFQIEFFRQNHNIPDNLGLVIKTPVGQIVHTADFKFDDHPVNELATNFEKLKRIGKSGVLLLMSDSTGAEEEGHSLSEKTIFENLEKIFKETKGRIIAASFASLINRIQQLITLSEKYGRKVVVEGYSMKTNVEIAQSLGKIKANKKTLIKAKDIAKFPDSQITVVCTGAQGEEGAAFMRIANREHKFIKIKKGDTIVFSSSTIPGNERSVQSLKDKFHRQAANVFHYQMMDIHASGHARREELRKMIEMMNPKFFMPVHGQYSMLVRHAELAREKGIPQENIIVAENGNIIELTPGRIEKKKKKVISNCIMVDGLGVGDIGEVVLRDRHALANDGMFVIIAVVDKEAGKVKGSPDIISRGFVYLRESQDLLKETRKRTIRIINRAAGSGGAVNWLYLKEELRNKIGQFLFSKTKKRPMVLPVIIVV